LADPETPAEHNETFKELSPQDEDLEDVVKRILALRERGLKGSMVAADFLWRRLAPLQRRSHPAWAFAGAGDKTRLWPGVDYNLMPDQHGRLMRELFVPTAVGVLPPTVFPLCNNNRRAAILSAMPRCDAQGVRSTDEERPSPGSQSPRGSVPSRGGDSSRASGGCDDEQGVAGEETEDSIPADFRRTSTGFVFTGPTAEETDEDSEDEDEGPLLRRRPRGPAQVQVGPGDKGPTETPPPPAKPAQTKADQVSGVKRKFWGSLSDDDEEEE
jgi:hypothetical protein